jgi:PKD repeat protein
MKTLRILTLLSTLFTANAFAQNGPEYFVLTATSVTNLATQAPVSMTMSFSNTGSDFFNQFDTTTVGVPPDPNNASLSSGRSLYPFTASADHQYLNKFDSRPVIHCSTNYEFGIYSEINDSVIITTSAFIDTNANLSNNGVISCVYLEDIYSGNFYPVLNNTATVRVYNSATFSNPYTTYFRLHIIVKPTITAYGVTCFGDSNGGIQMHTPVSTGWNYTLYQNGNALQSFSPGSMDSTITGLTAGNYEIAIYESGLLADSEEVIISSPLQVVAHFTPDTYSPFVNATVNFTNESTGATNYAWSFGDSSSDTVTDPSHSYAGTGDYTVTLIASNSNGCTSAFTDTIHVSNAPMVQGPHFSTMLYDPATDASTSGDATARKNDWHEPVMTSGAQKITLDQNAAAQNLQVTIMNTNGQLIHSVSSAEPAMSFDVPAAGVYVVMIRLENGETIAKKIMVN